MDKVKNPQLWNDVLRDVYVDLPDEEKSLLRPSLEGLRDIRKVGLTTALEIVAAVGLLLEKETQ